MAKPPTSVRSIRLTNETWEWLAIEALARGVNVNALVAELINRERLPAYAERAVARAETGGFRPPATPLMESIAKRLNEAALADYARLGPAPVHVAVPKLERKAFNPQPKTGKKK